MRVIINADDFGYNENVNQAIAEAFKRGWITNTTLMVNMRGTENAVSLARKNGFFDYFGLHLNLFEGIPLTDRMRQDPIFSDNGAMTSYKMFHQLNTIYKFFLPMSTRAVIKEECAAQMEMYNFYGFSEHHLDSHGHSHTLLSVYSIIRRLGKEKGFRTIRPTLNMYLKRKPIIRLYKKVYNYLLNKNYSTVDFFTSAEEFIDVAKCTKENDLVGHKCCIEIMVHPAYDENGKLINRGGPDFEELMKYLQGAELTNYCNLN